MYMQNEVNEEYQKHLNNNLPEMLAKKLFEIEKELITAQTYTFCNEMGERYVDAHESRKTVAVLHSAWAITASIYVTASRASCGSLKGRIVE